MQIYVIRVTSASCTAVTSNYIPLFAAVAVAIGDAVLKSRAEAMYDLACDHYYYGNNRSVYELD